MKPKEVDVARVVDLYVNRDLTLRGVSGELGIDHHRVKRILVSQGVAISRSKPRPPITAETRRKLSAARMGRSPWCKGIKMDEASRRKNMRGKVGGGLDFSPYPDYDRLLFMSRLFSKYRTGLESEGVGRLAFYDRFYFDPAFNAIFDAWQSRDKDRWWYPSLDHVQPKAAGGNWAVDNLRFITWFENRAKADMPLAEWEEFKRSTGTTSALFIESILP